MEKSTHYKALYRSFRPDTFEGVVGQRHITDILKSQVAHGTIAHAYLFCGPRGTGKTSTAKIFAKAVCCKEPVNGDACGKCDVCKNGELEDVDIIEIDAASNNGVEEIRNLREKVRLAPVYSAKKVYIIDEVHMLSQGAFNALLKTLEEPPMHVVFILATTEPHKLPATIISRCQRFDFHRVNINEIEARLEYICDELNAKYDKDALFIIARKAEGGLRDALSYLDQCMASGMELNTKNVLSVLGDVPFDILHSFLEAIINCNTDKLLSIIQDVVDTGLDLEIFLNDIISHARNTLIVRMVKNPENVIKVQGKQLENIILLSKQTNENRLIRTVDILTNAQSKMKYATSPRIVLEVAVLEAAMPETQTDISSLLDRIDTLEAKLNSIEQNGVQIDTSKKTKKHSPNKEKQNDIHTAEQKTPIQADTEPEPKIAEVSEEQTVKSSKKTSSSGKTNWSKILDFLEKEDIVLYTTASEGKFVNDDNNILTIAFEDDIFISALKTEARFNQLKNIVNKLCGYDNIDIIKKDDLAAKEEEDADVLELAFELFGEENVDIVDE